MRRWRVVRLIKEPAAFPIAMDTAGFFVSDPYTGGLAFENPNLKRRTLSLLGNRPYGFIPSNRDSTIKNARKSSAISGVKLY